MPKIRTMVILNISLRSFWIEGLFMNKKILPRFLSTFPSYSEKFQNPKTVKTHKYEQRWQYKDCESTSKFLLGQVFYNKDGVVALNKPSDLGSTRAECSIYNSLPQLAKELGYEDLKLVFVPEKSVSGVTILASGTSLTNQLLKALRRSKAIFSADPKQNFLAVTVGNPISDDDSQQYAVTKQYINKGNHYLILREWGKNAVKRREVNYGIVSHKVLAQSELASLVCVSTWQSRNHCPRIFLSDILVSPVLGDQKFGPRVSSLFGKPMIIKPWHAPAVKPLPPLYLQKLHLKSGAEELVPLHLHLHKLTLHQFFRNKSDLVLEAELPDYFKWTCQQLNLELPKPSETNHTSTQTQVSVDNINGMEKLILTFENPNEKTV